MNGARVTGVGSHYVLAGQVLLHPVGGDLVGWTLSGYREGVRCWSTNLARHGADAAATAATAQAVADRLLDDHGVMTCGWQATAPTDTDPGEHERYYALTHPAHRRPPHRPRRQRPGAAAR